MARDLFASDRTYNIPADFPDLNAFWDFAKRELDLGGYNLTAQVANGSYGPVALDGVLVGQRNYESVAILGDMTGNGGASVDGGGAAHAFTITDGFGGFIKGFKMKALGAGMCNMFIESSHVSADLNVMDAAGQHQWYVRHVGSFIFPGSTKYLAGSPVRWRGENAAQLALHAGTENFVNVCTYSTAGISLYGCSAAALMAMVFINKGNCKGKSHEGFLNSYFAGGGTETGSGRFLPGTIDGTRSSGTQWG